jgi:hypothetical protein
MKPLLCILCLLLLLQIVQAQHAFVGNSNNNNIDDDNDFDGYDDDELEPFVVSSKLVSSHVGAIIDETLGPLITLYDHQLSPLQQFTASVGLGFLSTKFLVIRASSLLKYGLFVFLLREGLDYLPPTTGDSSSHSLKVLTWEEGLPFIDNLKKEATTILKNLGLSFKAKIPAVKVKVMKVWNERRKDVTFLFVGGLLALIL